MNEEKKTHADFVNIIGGTAATYRNYSEKRWNQYYFKSFQKAVKQMLKFADRNSILDVGTSHGNWYNFLKKEKFNNIYGVELDKNRAELARQCGYTEVFNCDARNIPLPDESISAAVSNDVFVHILQIEDKAAVIKEIERLLKPGGVFILNHTVSNAFNFPDYHIENHCSFLSLDKFVKMIIENTNFKIVDIKPTYYISRNKYSGLVERMMEFLIYLPGGVIFKYFTDTLNIRKRSIEDSDTIYLKLRKK